MTHTASQNHHNSTWVTRGGQPDGYDFGLSASSNYPSLVGMFSLPLPCRCFFSPFLAFFLLTHIDQVCALVHPATLQDITTHEYPGQTCHRCRCFGSWQSYASLPSPPPPFVPSYSNYSPPTGCKEKPGNPKREHVVDKLAETQESFFFQVNIFLQPLIAPLLLSFSPPLSPSSSSSSYAHFLYLALPEPFASTVLWQLPIIIQQALARLSM